MRHIIDGNRTFLILWNSFSESFRMSYHKLKINHSDLRITNLNIGRPESGCKYWWKYDNGPFLDIATWFFGQFCRIGIFVLLGVRGWANLHKVIAIWISFMEFWFLWQLITMISCKYKGQNVLSISHCVTESLMYEIVTAYHNLTR